MDGKTYLLLEDYMKSCMKDSAHDREHIYRVLYTALEIADEEKDVDIDVLIAACLLHDIARQEQFEDPEVCHAHAGAEKAYAFLVEHGFSKEFAERVSGCIRTHRYRRNDRPESIEARILFDADKIDVSGAVGIARTLLYKGEVSEPLYSVAEDGSVLNGAHDSAPSFFQEYKYKLEGLYSNFFTGKGREIAAGRKQAAQDFYRNMLQEVREPYEKGRERLQKILQGNSAERIKENTAALSGAGSGKRNAIRRAVREDIPRIAEILIFAKRTAYRPIFRDDPVSFNEMQVVKLAGELEREGAIEDMVVYDDGIVRGLIERKTGDSPDYPDSVQLCSYYVDPFFQGGGIGKALIEYFLEEARECGCRSIYLWVLEKNSRARGIYESYGFVFDGTRQIEEGTPEYLRRYVLQNP